MMAHELTHTGQKPFVCKFKGCGKAYSRAGRLKLHQKQHVGFFISSKGDDFYNKAAKTAKKGGSKRQKKGSEDEEEKSELDESQVSVELEDDTPKFAANHPEFLKKRDAKLQEKEIANLNSEPEGLPMRMAPEKNQSSFGAGYIFQRTGEQEYQRSRFAHTGFRPVGLQDF